MRSTIRGVEYLRLGKIPNRSARESRAMQPRAIRNDVSDTNPQRSVELTAHWRTRLRAVISEVSVPTRPDGRSRNRLRRPRVTWPEHLKQSQKLRQRSHADLLQISSTDFIRWRKTGEERSWCVAVDTTWAGSLTMLVRGPCAGRSAIAAGFPTARCQQQHDATRPKPALASALPMLC